MTVYIPAKRTPKRSRALAARVAERRGADTSAPSAAPLGGGSCVIIKGCWLNV